MKAILCLLFAVTLTGCANSPNVRPEVQGDHVPLLDKIAVHDLVASWATYRDQERWASLQSTFHAEGTISLSWFSGPHKAFVSASRELSSKNLALLKHQLGVPLITLHGDRATSEVNVTILVRATTPFGEVDTTSYARFYDLLERRDGVWAIVTRTAIYEKDRIDPVTAGALPEQFFAGLDAFPAPVRFLAKSLQIAGKQIAPTTVFDSTPEMELVYKAGKQWLGRE